MDLGLTSNKEGGERGGRMGGNNKLKKDGILSLLVSHL